VALLALRYRRTNGTQRRQIRWLLFGITASLSLWIPAGALWQLADPDSAAAGVAPELLSGLAEVTTLGSVLGALFYTGVFGIDEPARRAFVHRVLRVSIGVALAVLAVLAGVITSPAAPVAVAVAVAVAAGAAGQTVRPRLEHLADRWVLGARPERGAALPPPGHRRADVPARRWPARLSKHCFPRAIVICRTPRNAPNLAARESGNCCFTVATNVC
jgi:hypothetical protein